MITINLPITIDISNLESKCEDFKYHYLHDPIIIMSNDTIDAIYSLSKNFKQISKNEPNKCIALFNGYKIFRDDDLNLGEVQLR